MKTKLCLLGIAVASAAHAWAPSKWDRAEDFVSDPSDMVRSLRDIHLASGTANTQAWSGNWLPVRSGAAAARPDDPGFPKYGSSDDWRQFHDYVVAHPASELIAANHSDRLSPTEKYDYLVGDKNFSLTRQQWNWGQDLFDRFGQVEAWIGLDSGWAAAATHSPEPRRPVTLTTADGQAITFTANDIKSLLALQWENNQVGSKIVGSRCNKSNPAVETNGRVIDETCRDTNPATWHLVLVNEIGRQRNAFNADLTYDAQVWMQAITGYHFEYFDLTNGKAGADFRPLKHAPQEVTGDRFALNHSSETASLIGVNMTFTYVVESTAFGPAAGDAANHSRMTVSYQLELDKDDNVIGGEWLENAHPDFLWRATNSRALSAVDDQIDPNTWNTASALPESWTELAPVASRQGQPIAAIVEKLVELSR